MEDGAAGEGIAALLVEQGTIISKSSSRRKSKEDGGTGSSCATGIGSSLNTTLPEMIM